MRKIEFILFFVFFLLLFQGKVLSVTSSILEHPSIVTGDPFIVKILVEGASAGQNYIRVDLYKEGTTGYFGETFNTSEWYSGSDGKKYFPITIESGQIATPSVLVRVGSPNISDFLGVGEYKMKIRRYTSSGNQANDTAQSVSLVINIPSPTLSPVPTNTPIPSPTTAPTKTQAITKTQAVTKTPTPHKSKTPIPTRGEKASISPKQEVLAGNIVEEKKVNSKVDVLGLGARDNILSFVFISFGFVFMIACAIFSFLAFKKYKKEEDIL